MVDLWDAIMINMMEFIWIYGGFMVDLWWIDQCNMGLDGI